MCDTNDPEFLFTIKNLTKDRRLHLRHASIPRHKLTLISGRTGCGKSTLVSILGLLQKADAGPAGAITMAPEKGLELDYHDLYPFRVKIEQIRRRYFGFVFQNDELIDNLTCFENMVFPLLVRKPWDSHSLDSLRKTVKKRLENFEFEDLYETLDRSPATLSGGQRQRLALIRGVIHDPPILIADEPIASVDGRTAQGIVTALKTYIQERSRTVILVIHDKDLSFFNDLCPFHIQLGNAAQE